MNGSNFGHIPALLIWSNMWKRSSRILAKNIKLILYRHLTTGSTWHHTTGSSPLRKRVVTLLLLAIISLPATAPAQVSAPWTDLRDQGDTSLEAFAAALF